MEQLFNSKIMTVLITIVIISALQKSKRNPYLFSFLNYPSIILHELAHYFVGKILLLRIKGIRLFPTIKRDEENKIEIINPSVSFQENNSQAFRIILMAIAPLSLLYVAYYVESNWYSWFNITSTFQFIFFNILLIYVISILIINSIPSMTDFSYLLAYPIHTFILIVITFLIIGYINNFPLITNNIDIIKIYFERIIYNVHI
jgi:hypothetical protein